MNCEAPGPVKFTSHQKHQNKINCDSKTSAGTHDGLRVRLCGSTVLSHRKQPFPLFLQGFNGREGFRGRRSNWLVSCDGALNAVHVRASYLIHSFAVDVKLKRWERTDACNAVNSTATEHMTKDWAFHAEMQHPGAIARMIAILN